MTAGEPVPGLVERRVGGRIGRHVPHRRAGELLQPEIGARGEPHHLQVLLDHRDERHEQRAVEPVLVELGGRHVRGGDHHDAELEQPLEQAAQDHGVGDVGDVEFVEAQQPGFLGDRGGGQLDRVLAAELAGLELLPERIDALVHVGHEFVEMHAALAHDRRRREEQIHQHGLAAADVAEDVETLDRLLLALARAEHPAERGGFAREAMLGDPPLELRELVDDRLLGGVALDLSGGDEGRILRGDGGWHERGGALGGRGTETQASPELRTIEVPRCHSRPARPLASTVGRTALCCSAAKPQPELALEPRGAWQPCQFYQLSH